MKTPLILAAIVCMALIPIACIAGEPTPQFAWSVVIGTNSPAITYSVRQIAADGGGGCAIVHTTFDGVNLKWYVTWFDKKGKQLWRTQFDNLLSLVITHCDKKHVVVSYAPTAGNKQMMIFDPKDNQLSLQDVGVDYYDDTNNSGESGTLGDAKGFFAVEYITTTKKMSIVRCLYKAEK